MEAIQLTQYDFDNMENRNPYIETIIATAIAKGSLTAHGVMADWISENLKGTKPYLGYNGEIYPKYKMKTITIIG